MAGDIYNETVERLRTVTANYDAAIKNMVEDESVEAAGPMAYRLEDVALRAIDKLRLERDIATACRAIDEAGALYLYSVMLDRALAVAQGGNDE